MLDPKQLYDGCHFLEQYDTEKLENNSKRLAYYYHYGVNIYLTNGKGNRAHLPVCLKNEIRSIFPNPPGVPYSDGTIDGGTTIVSLQTKITSDVTSTTSTDRNKRAHKSISDGNKRVKKSTSVVNKVSFRNPHIDVNKYGEIEAITHAIWKYCDLNGKSKIKRGVSISPYIDYILGEKGKYTGTVDQLWDLVKLLEDQCLIEVVEGGGYVTKNKRVPTKKID